MSQLLEKLTNACRAFVVTDWECTVPVPELTYCDATDLLVVGCLKCKQDGRPLAIAGSHRGTSDARSIIKEAKAHSDVGHFGEWSDDIPRQISSAIAEINNGSHRSSAAGWFELERRDHRLG